MAERIDKRQTKLPPIRNEEVLASLAWMFLADAGLLNPVASTSAKRQVHMMNIEEWAVSSGTVTQEDVIPF